MDPISLGLSIAGLVAAADAIFVRVMKLAKVIKAIKNVEEDVATLSREMNDLAGLLHRLRNTADALEGEPFDNTLRIHHVSSCSHFLSAIRKRLDDAEIDLASPSQFRRAKRKLAWPFSSSETKELLAELERHQSYIRLALSADSMNALRRCLSRQEDIHSAVTEISQDIMSLKQTVEIEARVRLNKTRKTVRDYFMKVNPQTYLHTYRELRHPMTGLWITHLPAFTDWLSIHNSKLWLSGIPGAGKTVLATTVIEEVMGNCSLAADKALAFFFCDYQEEKSLKVENILGALAAQIAIQKSEAFDLIQNYYDELHADDGLEQVLSIKRLVSLIQEMADMFDQVWVVVDGLDECSNKSSEVVRILSDLVEGKRQLSIALISRDVYTIRDALHSGFVEVEISAHSDDVSEYVSAELERRLQEKSLRIKDMNLKHEILNSVVDGAKGMFRWVACQLDHLCELQTDKARRKALTELPSGLEDTYLRILERVPRSRRGLVQKTLFVLAFAEPKLKSHELCQLLLVSESDDNTDVDESDLIPQEEVSRACSSLVRISTHDGGQYFEFAHFSVREFLESEAVRCPDPQYKIESEFYLVSKPTCYQFLATQSLRALLLNGFSQVPTAKSNTALLAWHSELHKDSAIRGHFYIYAANFWIKYARGSLSHPPISGLVKQLFDPRKTNSFMGWLFAFQSYMDFLCGNEHVEMKDLTHQQLQPIHIAAVLGLGDLCNFLIKSQCRTDIVGAMGSPLECAIGGVSKILADDIVLDHPEGLSWMYNNIAWSATDAASTIQYLLADINSSSRSLPTDTHQHYYLSLALHNSIYLGNFHCFIVLHSAGAVLNQDAVDTFQQTAWRWQTHPNVDASFNELVHYLNPLILGEPLVFELCSFVWGKAVRWGLRFSSDSSSVNTQICLSEQNLPLEAISAIIRDDLDALETILRDPRLDTKGVEDEAGQSLLHLAVMHSSARIVSLLLDAGCAISKHNHDGEMPIHLLDWRPLLLEGDTLKILQLLVAHGATASTKNSKGWTLWFTDLKNILKWLIEHETMTVVSEALQTRYKGHTPYSDAVRQGYEDKVLLLNKWMGLSSDNSTIYLSGPPFLDAAHGGSEVIVQAVIDAGFEPATSVTNEVSPLHLIGPRASPESARLLKSLFEDSALSRCNNRLPLEAYVQRCCAERPIMCPDLQVMKELVCDQTLDSKDSNGIMIWDYVTHSVFGSVRADSTNKDTTKILEDVAIYLIELGAMKAYEDRTNTCGLLPCLNFLNDALHGMCWPFGSTSVNTIIAQSKLWPTMTQSPQIIRLLKRAICGEDYALTLSLLEKGVDIHQSLSGISALEQACICGFNDASFFCAVLDHAKTERLNDFLTDGSGRTLLHCLAETERRGVPNMVEELLDRGADPNLCASSTTNDPPLVWHIGKSKFRTARILLSRGADPTIPDVDGLDSALIAATRNGLDFLKTQLASWTDGSRSINWTKTCKSIWIDDKESQRLFGANALHLAAATAQHACLEFYLDRGFISDINSPTVGGQTPMHVAASFGNTNTVTFLRDRGGNVNSRTAGGRLPLHYAALHGKSATVRELLRLGSEHTPDKHGKTPLAYALAAGNESVIIPLRSLAQSTTAKDQKDGANEPGFGRWYSKELAREFSRKLEMGELRACEDFHRLGFPLDVSLPPCWECPPLIHALLGNHQYITTWLLKKGVSTTPISCEFHLLKTAIDLAIASHNFSLNSILPTLLTKNLDDGAEWARHGALRFYTAVKSSNIAAIKILLNHLEENSDAYGTTLGIPANKVVRKVINQRISFKETSWSSLLHKAADLLELEAVTVLLEHGAEVNAVDYAGQTPLLLVLGLDSSRDVLPVVETLLKYGAAMDRRGKNGHTPAMQAAAHNHVEALECLLRKGCDISHNGTGRQSILHAYISSDEPNPGLFSRLVSAGVDPWKADVVSSESLDPVQLAFCLDSFVSFNLNGDFDLTRLRPLVWHVCYYYFDWIITKFKLVRRKFDKIDTSLLADVLNLQPQPAEGWSPLCIHACTDKPHEMMQEFLLCGADIDYEGCPHGSALMAASHGGKLEAVRLLVRNGAKLSYKGHNGWMSAFDAARKNKQVLQWLLVGRYTDQDKIEQQSSNEDALCKPWSGTTTREIDLVGGYKQRADESMINYAIRLAKIKMNLRGKMVPLARGWRSS